MNLGASSSSSSGVEERDSHASKKRLFSFVDAVATSEAENLSRVAALHEELLLENRRVQERRARLDSLLKVMHDYADSKRQVDVRKGRNVLQLSLGGEHADVKASTLAGNRGGYPNMLSRILTSGRYDAIFLRDRDGRIFLDFESGWVEPLIDHLRILSVSIPGAALAIPKVRLAHQNGFKLVTELFNMIDSGISSTIPTLQNTAKVHRDEGQSEPDAAFLTPFLQELVHVPDSASLPFVSRMTALVGSLDALPPRAVELTNYLIEARARVAVEEAELLHEILLATHLFLKPLGELDAALAAVRADQGVEDGEGGEGGEIGEEPAVAPQSSAAAPRQDMCDKIEAAYHEMRTLLEARLACPAPDRVDDLIYYNVGGKKVGIRRSTLISSLPDSALAIAAGPAWNEQQDDLLDGYIFIDHPKAAFLSILAFARLQALVAGRGGAPAGAVIRIEREEEASLKHLLEYFRVSVAYTL